MGAGSSRRKWVGDTPHMDLKTWEKCERLRKPTDLATHDTVRSSCSRSRRAQRMRRNRINALVEQPIVAWSLRLTCIRLYPNSWESVIVSNSGSAMCPCTTSTALLTNAISCLRSKDPRIPTGGVSTSCRSSGIFIIGTCHGRIRHNRAGLPQRVCTVIEVFNNVASWLYRTTSSLPPNVSAHSSTVWRQGFPSESLCAR